MSALADDWRRRLDQRVHALYLATLPEADDDEEFVFLHNLKVECDPECNRLVRALRSHALRHGEAV